MEPSTANTFILITLLIFLSASPTLASTSNRHPWHSPCSLRRRLADHQLISFSYGTHEPVTSLPHYIHELKIAARRARASALGLYQHILTRRLPSRLQEECVHNDRLQGIPSADERSEHLPNRFASLPVDFQHLAVLTVFVQEATNDTLSYHRHLTTLRHRLVRLNCLVETTSLTMDLAIHSDVTDDVMPPQYRNLPNQGQRDRRNCLVARDAFRIVDAIYNWYWPTPLTS